MGESLPSGFVFLAVFDSPGLQYSLLESSGYLSGDPPCFFSGITRPAPWLEDPPPSSPAEESLLASRVPDSRLPEELLVKTILILIRPVFTPVVFPPQIPPLLRVFKRSS